jgi:MFS family permease
MGSKVAAHVVVLHAGRRAPLPRFPERVIPRSMLRPSPHVSAAQLAAGQRHLVLDLGWASVSGAFSGGVILAAFALALSATPLQIGLLAAIPFMAQALQLPATLMIERVRQRRRIAVVTITAARVLTIAMAALPFLPVRGVALGGLLGAQVLIAALNAVGACAMSSWLHQLIPHEELGSFFARRLFSGTTFACVATLAAGALVDHWHGDRLHAYGVAFAVAGLTGFVSSFHIARTPEPQMGNAGPAVRVGELLRLPFRDRNFRRVLAFMAAWTVASNVVAPFLTVYLLGQRGYSLGTVTHLWVVSQLANAVTLYVWGRLSDRLSNKAVLDAALPVYFASILALVFVGAFSGARSELPVLYLIHLAMGVASGGIGLATGNLGLKLAPEGKATAYLASIGLACAVAGGIAPIAAGAIAETLKFYQVSAVVRWTTPGSVGEKPILTFAHWEFLFAISTAIGFYVMHALSRIREGDETSEHQVMQEFALEAVRALNNMSPLALGTLFPFERLTDRRKWWRRQRRA